MLDNLNRKDTMTTTPNEPQVTPEDPELWPEMKAPVSVSVSITGSKQAVSVTVVRDMPTDEQINEMSVRARTAAIIAGQGLENLDGNSVSVSRPKGR